MKKTISLISLMSASSLLLLNACSTSESFQAKMDRYIPKNHDRNIVPEIKVTGLEFKINPKGRMPASENKNENKETSLTNKKLYFLSLVDQYESLKQYSSKFDAPAVSICPNFHTGLVTHYEKYADQYNKKSSIKYNYNKTSMNNDSYITTHPELYLPMTKDSNTPRVLDIVKNNTTITENEINTLVQSAIDIHLAKTYFEITELCEYGTSDNYYIYENLITHIKNSTFNPNVENMNILLKTTVFSNMALINSLEKQKIKNGRSIASENGEGNIYSKELINKMNVSWSVEYFKTLKN